MLHDEQTCCDKPLEQGLSFYLDALVIAGRELLEPLQLHVRQGEILVLMGASGAGKSTLLRAMAGLSATTEQVSARLYLDQERLDQQPAHLRRLGLLFQDPLLFPHFSVAQNLSFAAKRRLSASEVTQLLRSVGLEGALHTDPAKLSGGEKARLSLLRCLVNQPRALLLDEPFAQLDAARKQELRALIVTQIRQHKLPAVLVSHDPQEYAALKAQLDDKNSIQQLVLG